MGCYNSTVVPASVEMVWAVLRDFHDMTWAPNVITDLERVGDTSGDTPGARRVLNGAFQETLMTVDEGDRTFSYRIDDGPDAVSKDNVTGYLGTVRVLPVTDDGTAFVVWTSTWESGGEGAAEFCNPIYQALLGELKSRFS